MATPIYTIGMAMQSRTDWALCDGCAIEFDSYYHRHTTGGGTGPSASSRPRVAAGGPPLGRSGATESVPLRFLLRALALIQDSLVMLASTLVSRGKPTPHVEKAVDRVASMAVGLSDDAGDNRAVQFPARSSRSVSDIAAGLSQEPSIRGSDSREVSVHILSSWTSLLEKRVPDLPFYSAWKGTAAIAALLSERSIPESEIVRAALQHKLPWVIHAEGFLGGSVPLLRMQLGFPTPDGGHFFFENPLDIRQGDVQEFCKALLADEHIDVILRHSDMTDRDLAYMAGFRARGFAAILRKELAKMTDNFPASLSPNAFAESVAILEKAYASSRDGIVNSRKAPLLYEGDARNKILYSGRDEG